MGLFSNVSSFVGKKLQERDVKKQEDRELAEARSKALKEARLKTAPVLARKQAELEINMKLADIKTGKGSGSGFSLQNLAQDIGQSTGSMFQRDFDSMMGGGGSGGRKKESSQRNAFDDEYDKMFGKAPSPKRSKQTKKTKERYTRRR